MNRLKDFFYNKNDIIVVLIILVAAGFLIYNRIGAIMDYPAELAKANATSVTTQTTEVTTVEQSSEHKDKTSEEDE